MNKTIEFAEEITLDIMYKEMELNIRNFSQIENSKLHSNPMNAPESINEEEYLYNQLKNLEELKGIFDSLFAYIGLNYPDTEKIVVRKTDNDRDQTLYDVHLNSICISISAYAAGPFYRVGELDISYNKYVAYDMFRNFLIKVVSFDQLSMPTLNIHSRDSVIEIYYHYNNNLEEVGNLYPGFVSIVIDLFEILVSDIKV